MSMYRVKYQQPRNHADYRKLNFSDAGATSMMARREFMASEGNAYVGYHNQNLPSNYSETFRGDDGYMYIKKGNEVWRSNAPRVQPSVRAEAPQSRPAESNPPLSEAAVQAIAFDRARREASERRIAEIRSMPDDGLTRQQMDQLESRYRNGGLGVSELEMLHRLRKKFLPHLYR